MDVYSIVTEKVIQLLESGTVPWRKPWLASDTPRNLISKKAYRGINTFLLSATKFASPYWLTYKQATELGGNVRKGEQSTLIIFWKIDAYKTKDQTEQAEDQTRTRCVLRYYRVFNLEQCDLPQAVLDKLPKPESHDFDPIEAAERIVASMPNGPTIAHRGAQAFYRASDDTVTLPPRDTFNSASEYYATEFHELTHSTGHAKRLNRETVGHSGFGSKEYSKEELVAELGAAFLCAESGISNAVIENQAAYIASWLKVLRSDARLIVYAAANAQKAADHILDRKYSD